MTDDRTPNLDLPLPSGNNLQSVDVGRLRSALTSLDAAVASKASTADVAAAINAVIDAAPGALDTLNELAAALGDDPNFAATIASQIAAINAELDAVSAVADAAMPADRVASATVLGAVKVGDGLVIDEFGAISNPDASAGTQSFSDEEFTATAGQTVFVVPSGYAVDQIDVHVNGAKLGAADYVATNGTTVTLVEAASDGDILVVRKWLSFSLALIATKLQAEAGTNNSKVMTPLRVSQAITAHPALKLLRSARTANISLGVDDKGTLVDVTSGTFSQTFSAAATLGNGWWCYVKNSGSGNITLDPASTETIDGQSTLGLSPGDVRLVMSDGSALHSVLLAGGPQIMVVCEEVANGGSLDAFIVVDNAYHTRVLTTVKSNSISGASLAGNSITLPAGEYYVDASVPCWGYNQPFSQARLFNVTGGSALVVGTIGVDRSRIKGRFSLSAQSVVRIEHAYAYFGDSFAGAGNMDFPANISPSAGPLIMTEATITKLF